MKYLKSWIKRELHPSESVDSKSTDSFYYDVDGVKIRVSDHYGHFTTCDILVVVTPDVKFGKHYVIQDTQYPQLMIANSLPEAKQIISVLLLVKRGMVGKQRMNDRNREIVEKIVKKMNIGMPTTQMDMCEFGKHAHLVCPGYSQLSNHYRSIVRELYRMGMPSETLRNMIFQTISEKPDEDYDKSDLCAISGRISAIHSDLKRKAVTMITESRISSPTTPVSLPSNIIPANPVALPKYNEDLEIVRHLYKGANSIKKMTLAQACQFWTHVNSGFIELFGQKWKCLAKGQRKSLYELLRTHGLTLDEMIEFIKTTNQFGTSAEITAKVNEFAKLKKVS